MQSLPRDLVLTIISYAGNSTAYNCALVCKEWNSLLDTGHVSVEDYLGESAIDCAIPYLSPLRHRWYSDLPEYAVEGCGDEESLCCLRYLCENGCDYDEENVIDIATKLGKTECTKYAISRSKAPVLWVERE